MDVHLRPSLDGHREGDDRVARPKSSGPAAEPQITSISVSTSILTHDPPSIKRTKFHNPIEGSGLFDSSCFCLFDD